MVSLSYGIFSLALVVPRDRGRIIALRSLKTSSKNIQHTITQKATYLLILTYFNDIRLYHTMPSSGQSGKKRKQSDLPQKEHDRRYANVSCNRSRGHTTTTNSNNTIDNSRTYKDVKHNEIKRSKFCRLVQFGAANLSAAMGHTFS